MLRGIRADGGASGLRLAALGVLFGWGWEHPDAMHSVGIKARMIYWHLVDALTRWLLPLMCWPIVLMNVGGADKVNDESLPASPRKICPGTRQ